MKQHPVALTAVLVRAYNYRGNSRRQKSKREVVWEAYEAREEGAISILGRLLTVGNQMQCMTYLRRLQYRVVVNPTLVFFRQPRSRSRTMKAAFPDGHSSFVERIPTEALARLIVTHHYRGGEHQVSHETEDIATGEGVAWALSRSDAIARTRKIGYRIPAEDLVDPLERLVIS